ncbi:MAG TPA: ABC transporter substrate-binding protein [Trebonia sp.]|jgi:NitT/TauT family transport system substrate-binding protein|nr:ABC transporter substrate-binding protein [Trebonia sp.]
MIRPRIARWAAVGAALATAATLATACSSSGSSASGGGSQAAGGKALTDVSMVEDPTLSALAIYVAKQEGMFTKNGLNVTITPQENITLIPQAISAGQYDFGLTAQPLLFNAVQRNLPLIASAGGEIETANPPLGEVMVPKSSGIKSAKDLVGKTIGVAALVGATPVCLLSWFKSQGLNYTAKTMPVKMVQVSFQDQLSQLQAGQIQAAMSISPYWQPMTKQGFVGLGNACATVSQSQANDSFQISDSSWVQSHKATVKAVQTALNQADQWMTANPAQAIKILATMSGVSLSALQGVQLPPFTSTVSETQLTQWLATMKSFGSFTGSLPKPMSSYVFAG